MELCQITELTQLKKYYEQEGLTTVEEKIDRLKDIMKVRAVRCEFGSTEDDLLIGL